MAFGFGRKKTRPLTRKQRAQRKYASRMKQLRARATRTRGGKGRIRARKSPTNLRRKLGLK